MYNCEQLALFQVGFLKHTMAFVADAATTMDHWAANLGPRFPYCSLLAMREEALARAQAWRSMEAGLLFTNAEHNMYVDTLECLAKLSERMTELHQSALRSVLSNGHALYGCDGQPLVSSEDATAHTCGPFNTDVN